MYSCVRGRREGALSFCLRRVRHLRSLGVDVDGFYVVDIRCRFFPCGILLSVVD